MMTDPVADLLTRVRNANSIGQKSVSMPASKLKVGIVQILQEEGFVDSYTVEPGAPASTLVVKLKYGPDGEKVIRKIERISKPGCRVYSDATSIPTVLRGLGILILSTNRGVLSDRTARKLNAGGEILCKVY
jgi:small subunit ribosomal protein S8